MHPCQAVSKSHSRIKDAPAYVNLRMLPSNIQIVLFSATFPDYVVKYAENFAPKANQITLKHEELTIEGIKQLYLECTDEKAKYANLIRLYGLMTIGSSIIFVKVCNERTWLKSIAYSSSDSCYCA